ncbi:hypothetical protein [Nocardioides coralli]|uniref:hypothetical protein n=1 Tax=Nocardioides coralli TaxID=2872154 RepID=UPI001CA3D17A|nr:hypothetical protein [Nocardioides coralli]QZY27662.1 hypothetical protein K6T13_09015 [Nocardioides coralli]
MAGESELERTELEAVLETRAELGPAYDAALVDSFADRVEAVVATRVAQQVSSRPAEAPTHGSAGSRQLALGIVTGAFGIPVTAISLAVPEGEATGLLAMVVGWAGLVGINVAHAVQTRRSG